MGTGCNSPAVYQGLGWFYDRYWREYGEAAAPALDRLVVARVPRGARILDLCCGTGQIAADLTRRGFRVTGLDGSLDMLVFARRSAPEAALAAADARCFALRPCFDAAICTFDSLNHLLRIADVEAAMRNVHDALVPGGLFIFDINMEEAYRREWGKSSTIAEPDHLCYVRGRYDAERRLGVTEITTFRLENGWTRQDLTVYQRCYTRGEMREALARVGFRDIEVQAAKALGVEGRLAIGRVYFTSRKT